MATTMSVRTRRNTSRAVSVFRVSTELLNELVSRDILERGRQGFPRGVPPYVALDLSKVLRDDDSGAGFPSLCLRFHKMLMQRNPTVAFGVLVAEERLEKFQLTRVDRIFPVESSFASLVPKLRVTPMPKAEPKRPSRRCPHCGHVIS